MDEKEQIAAAPSALESATGKKKGFNLKVILFGIPIFIIQLVAVYFITANFLINNNHSAEAKQTAEGQKVEGEKGKENKQGEQKVELGKFIYMVEDLIINPANTDGKRLLLSSLGFDVASQPNQEELKTKDVLLKDAVISVMSSKNLTQLANMAYRDTLRTEITKRIQTLMPEVKINTIYFSKYILQ